ncbi:hypothetical protein [Fluviicola taffensis]|uniref:Uncharacterized protein n=1 Tax=Fluviicola taffensis (strain DSM 16823 / NCIMB 13979 / RW262) TaxID=755732 RepID=F2II12_FLUTR|nr:hypothetical protein [Fluviicola taffensis]AEA42712.1 hypothetical protein Fluta_0708 [Fluviicola taffensis DSM 16823]
MSQFKTFATPYPFQRPAFIGIREYSFTNSLGDEYSVQFVQKNNQITNYIVDLSLRSEDRDEYQTMNTGDVYKVMATVIDILIDFIEHTTYCQSIEFVPVSESNHLSNRRSVLFLRYVQFFKKLTGWNYTVIDGVFTLTRPNTK